MNKYTRFGIVFGLFTIVDQISKIWIESRFKCPGIGNTTEAEIAGKLPFMKNIPVVDNFLGFSFDINHVHNQGAAFGMMQGQMFVFAIFTIVAVVFIGGTLKAMEENDHFQNFSLALIASGAIGNAIDRGRLGYVVDFLHAYAKDKELIEWLRARSLMTQWPSFNIADAAIVVGVILFFIHSIFFVKDEEDEDDDLLPSEVKDEI